MARRLSSSLFRRILRDQRGSVTTLAALSLPVMLGGAGLAFDLSRGYGQKVVNQRVADMAALSVALEYQDNNSVDLESAAAVVAAANRLEGVTVKAKLVDDYPYEGDKVVEVTITRDVPYLLAAAVGLGGNFTVSAVSAAVVESESPYDTPCFLALSTGKDALVVNGGASINAPGCSVAAIGGLANKGDTIEASQIVAGLGDIVLNSGWLKADSLRYGGELKVPQWNNQLPALADRHNAKTDLFDPWKDNLEIAEAEDKLGSRTAPPELFNPVTPGGAKWDLSWSPSNAVKQYRVGDTNRYVIPAGNYDISSLTVDGGIDVVFQSGSRITVSNGVAVGGGSSVNFGDSDVYINGGFNSGSNGVTFGDGTLWIGDGKIDFLGTNRKGDGKVVINDTLNLGGGQSLLMGDGDHYFKSIKLGGGGDTLMGNGDFVVSESIDVQGDSELAIGNGDVIIGTPKSGAAVSLSGSARFLMGDGSTSIGGDIKTMGGSRMVFGDTANHYIDGDMDFGGSVYFGAGRYTVNGDFVNGTGGTTWPYTSSLTGETYGGYGAGFDMAGQDVTFILAGLLKLAGGALTKLSAPSYSQSGAQIAQLLFHSAASGASNWTGGTGNVFSGTIHFPNASVTMAGGNSTADGGTCFMLIADEIKAAGGATAGSKCLMTGSAGGETRANSRIRLVR